MASLIFMPSDIVTAAMYAIVVSIHILSPIPIKVWGPLSVAFALCEGQIALHSEYVNTHPGATMLGLPLWSFAKWAVIVAWLLDVGRAIAMFEMQRIFIEKKANDDIISANKRDEANEKIKHMFTKILQRDLVSKKIIEREKKLIQKTE